MGYNSVAFRVSDEEKEALRDLAKEKGLTLSKLCGDIVRDNCLECEHQGGQVFGEGDLAAIADAVAERLNGGFDGWEGELPESEKLESYIETAVEANGLDRDEVIARLLSYAISKVSPKPEFLLTSIEGIKNNL